MKRTVRFAFVLSILVMFATLGNEAWGQRRVSNSSNHATEIVRSNAGSVSRSAANNSRGAASVSRSTSAIAGSSSASVSRSANVSRSSSANVKTAANNSSAVRSAGSASASRSANVSRSSSANVKAAANNSSAVRSAGSASVSRNVYVNRSVNAARNEMHTSNNGKAEMHVSNNAVHMNNHVAPRADMGHWHHPYVNDRPMIAPYHIGHHNYGYRIHDIPFGARVVRYRGHKYYNYGGIWYRRYRGDYIIVRPPFGERIAVAMFNYTLARIWVNTVINDIRRAERAAELARAYAAVNTSYVVRNANEMSYAADNVNYYYNDGVFYILEGNEYVVIEAPIGALVTEIPEDYEEIVVGGETYYKVDNILFKTAVVDGNIYFEVVSNL
ncbi:MAG: hypothetical protein KBT44_07115 [Bacteroidales bacterium]|nr:hypothetical protein [Candidatus Equibacterium intestinale]